MPSDPVVPVAELHVHAVGLDHSEGICVTRDGRVFVGGEAGQVYRVDADGIVTEIANTGGFCLGLAADAEGRLYVCDPGRREVLRVTPETGEIEVVSSGGAGRGLANPNWGCFAPDGTYYFSDSGAWEQRDGLIWRLRHGATEPWTTESRNFPNGMAVSPDGRTLYVLESEPPAFVAFDIREDGSAGPRRVITEMPGTVPDGIALTTDGRFVISCYRPDAVYLVDAGGAITLLAEDPKGTALAAPTNVTFVGPELDTILVPNLGRWHITRFAVPGLRGIPLHYPTREQIGA
jgi:gluconolactonase